MLCFRSLGGIGLRLNVGILSDSCPWSGIWLYTRGQQQLATVSGADGWQSVYNGVAMVAESTQAWLSIWRNFAPSAPLAVPDADVGWRIVDTDWGLQEQVYSWPLPTDPFGGVVDDGVRDDLREALYGRLAVSLLPGERGIAVLHEFVEKAKLAVREGHAGPLPAATSTTPSTHPPMEPNPLLALAIHLEWLVRCFGGRPHVSVTIR